MGENLEGAICGGVHRDLGADLSHAPALPYSRSAATSARARRRWVFVTGSWLVSRSPVRAVDFGDLLIA
jgi:hypothetical protein